MAFYKVCRVQSDGCTITEDFDHLEDAFLYFLESQSDVGRYRVVSLHFSFEFPNLNFSGG